MQNLPNEIVDQIYSYTNPEICIRDKQYYALTKFPEVTIDWAAKNEHLEIVKYLHEKVGIICPSSAVYWAINNGYLEIVKYFYEVVGARYNNYSAMGWASENRHTEIIEYLRSV